MAFRIRNKQGCLALLAFLFILIFGIAYLIHSSLVWIGVVPVGLMVLMLIIAALPIKRKITPQKWADELEKHLLGTDGPYGWDNATSITLHDKRMENLRARLIPDFDTLETPEKREEFRQIIEALRRGEVP